MASMNGIKKRNTSDEILGKGDNIVDDKGGNNNIPGILDHLILYDIYITEKMAVCATGSSKHGFLRPLMVLLEYSGHGIPWLIGITLTALLCEDKFIWNICINFYTGIFIDLIVVFILKALFRRKRPIHNEMDMLFTVSVDVYSFPSGHATRAGMLLFMTCFQFDLLPKYDVILTLWSLCVALSRVLLGRHHLSDVLVGYVFGLATGWFILQYIWLDVTTSKQIMEVLFRK